MKDNISLIAAAAGGFMLSVALAGILRGTPVTTLQGRTGVNYYPATNLEVTSMGSNESADSILEKEM